MKTKRLLLLLVLTLSSFFFFLGNVKADTYNFTMTGDPFSHINSTDYDDWKTKVLQYRDSLNVPNLHYAIYWRSNKYQAELFTNDSLSFSFNDLSTNYPNAGLRSPTTGTRYYICNNNNTPQNCGSGEGYTNYIITTCQKLAHTCDPITFLETDVPITSTETNIFVITYNDYTFTYPNEENLYSSTNWYNYYYGDDTPLLTSFINVVIDRLTFITSSLHENYILLSCFTIFTLFFIILLFRRLQ